MFLVQQENEPIRDFIARIDQEFVDMYGTNFQDSRFRRATKSQWLYQGMKQSIFNELSDNYEDTWPAIVRAAQDAEWLASLIYKENNLTGRYAYSYDRDFCVQDGRIVVYVDGACFRNGQAGAQAGIGVWFGRHSRM